MDNERVVDINSVDNLGEDIPFDPAAFDREGPSYPLDPDQQALYDYLKSKDD